MDEDSDVMGTITIAYTLNGVSLSIDGKIGPTNLWAAGDMLRVEGDMLYMNERATQMRPSNGLLLAQSIPQDHKRKA